DDDESGKHFVERFNAEVFKQHLKQGIDRPQEHAIKFALHDVGVAKLVEVHTEHVEQAEGDEREAEKEQQLFKAPVRQAGNPLEQHDHKSQGEEGRCE